MAFQFAYAYAQRACTNGLILCYDSGVVLRLSFGKELERAWVGIPLVLIFTNFSLRPIFKTS